MRILLDTHPFLWFTSGDPSLPVELREIIQASGNEVLVSLVSCWEIAIKFSIGRLELTMPLDQLFNEAIEGNGLESLSIERAHLLAASALPSLHGDPFDRLLVAQAKMGDLSILSHDPILDALEVTRIWLA